MNNTKTVNQGEAAEKFILGLGKVFGILFSVCFYGVKRFKHQKFNGLLYLSAIGVSCAYMALKNYWHLLGLHYLMPELFDYEFIEKLWLIDSKWHFWVLFSSITTIALFFLGLKEFRWIKKINRAIGDLAFKTQSGQKPKILKVEDLGDGRTKLLVHSGGQGIDRFTTKKGDLSASIGQIVEVIRQQPGNPSNVEIYLCEKELTDNYPYKEAKELAKAPYSFVIGKSYKGPVVLNNIRELPHLFICGTTGGGKSNFLNNVLLGLMGSSDKIRFYLIDMKKGLEVQDYKDLPNVEIAKSEKEALHMLTKLNEMMDERFSYLEKMKKKKINPSEDNKDLVIVAFDEVSEIFDLKTKSAESKKLREQIYEKAHRLSKLSRAAGFSMIFCTQKIKKNLLPTEIQTNIGGRISFKLPTIADSVAAIGNKMAVDLPDVKGRAVWHRGNDYIRVQTPFLRSEDIEEELEMIHEKFSRSKKTKDDSRIVEELTPFEDGYKD